MDQARIRFDAKDVPVAIGGVTIHPGDIIVADGDGVIAVPRQAAREVARYADQEKFCRI
jgi:regulator of RNase E activity RraA